MNVLIQAIFVLSALSVAVVLFILILRKTGLFTVPKAMGCRKTDCKVKRVYRPNWLRSLSPVLPTRKYACDTCKKSFTRIKKL